jgi:penicillin-insensitive murein DD-endopeptidase
MEGPHGEGVEGMLRLILSLALILFSFATASAIEPRGKSARAGAKVTKTATAKPAKPIKKKKAPPPGPPAKELFAAVGEPAPLAARSIGGYSKGCMAGGVPLSLNGPNWQVMRLSRNRIWGTPRLVDFVERLASDARALDDWPGLLVGDMSQPRGGPMLTGHTSHQIGLDADIWLTPMPDRTLTAQEREDIKAASMLKDPFSVDPNVFTIQQVKLIKRAASYPQLSRIFVHPAIKKALCEQAPSVGKDRSWLGKVRPWWNHHYHFHVRLSCPSGDEGCDEQKPVTGDDGCGDELKNWYNMLEKAAIWAAEQNTNPEPEPEPAPDIKPEKKTDAKPPPGKPPLRLGDLPKDCATVLAAGGHKPMAEAEMASMPAIIRAKASKDAGVPVPLLDAAGLQALLARDKKGGKDASAEMTLPDRNPIR